MHFLLESLCAAVYSLTMKPNEKILTKIREVSSMTIFYGTLIPLENHYSFFEIGVLYIIKILYSSPYVLPEGIFSQALLVIPKILKTFRYM